MASRQNLQIEVPVKLNLAMQEAQSQIQAFKNQLKNLSPDTTAYKALTKQISLLESASEKMGVQLSKPFKSQKDIERFGNSFEKLVDGITLLSQGFQNLSFEDLLFSPTELQKVQDFDNQIKQLQADILALKNKALSSAKGSFFGVFSDAGITSADNYEKALKKIETGLEKAEKRANSAKEALTEATQVEVNADSKVKNFKKNATQLATSVMNGDPRFFAKNGNVKGKDAREALRQEMVNIGFDESTAKDLASKTASEIRKFFDNVASYIPTRLDALKKESTKATSARVQAQDEVTKSEKLVTQYQGAETTLKAVPNTQAYKDATAEIDKTRQAEDAYKESVVQAHVATQEGKKGLQELPAVADKARAGLEDAADAADRLNERMSLLQGIQNTVKHWFGFYQILNMTRSAVRSMVSNVRELDKVITDIAVVTDMTQKDLWAQMDSYSSLAQQYGTTIKGVYEVSQLYYQQGLQTNEVMKLTEQTLVMAKVSGLDYAKATDYMTVAVRGFSMEMSEAQKVTDVYSALAAKTATDTTELATAMSKVASGAASVGSSFESTSAMLATMISVTREAPENLGSALKSIVSRFGELKSDPSTLVDSEGEALSLNNVDKALQSVGISLHDVNGQFRDFDDVIMELAEKWNTIDKNAQRYIATVAAGNRQQSRFLALVGNYDLLKESMDIAANSEDEGALQMLKTMDSMETKINQLQNSVKLFYTSSGVEELMKTIVDFGTTVVNYLNNMPKLFGKLPVVVLTTLVNLVSTIKQLLYNNITELIAKIKNDTQQTAKEIENNSEKSGTNTATRFINAFKAKFNELKNLGSNIASGNISLDSALMSSLQKTVQGIKKYGTQIGAVLQMASIAISNGNERLAQGLSGAGNLASGIAQIASGSYITGAFSLISGLAQVFDALNYTIEEKIADLEKELTELNNDALLKKNKYKTFESSLEKYEKLKEAQYDSAEAAQEAQEAANSLAEEYPDLIKSYDDQGNAIVEVAGQEKLLAKLRRESADAAYEASLKEMEIKEAELEKAKQNAYNEKASYMNSSSLWITNGEIVESNGDHTLSLFFEEGTEPYVGIDGKQVGGTAEEASKNPEIQEIPEDTLKALREANNKFKSAEDSESREQAFDEYLELVNEVFISYTGEVLKSFDESEKEVSQAREAIKAYATKPASEKLYSDLVDKKTGEEWSLVEDSSGLFSMLAFSIAEEFRASGQEWEDFAKDKDFSEYDIVEKAEEFWETLSDNNQEIFNKMFADSDKYSSEDIISKFNIQDGKLKQELKEYYKVTSDENEEALTKLLEITFSDTLSAEYKAFSEAIENEDEITGNERALITDAIKYTEELKEKGLNNLATSYAKSFSALFSSISQSSNSAELFDLMKSADFTTITGIQAFQKQIEESELLDKAEKQEILKSLTSLTSSIVVNLNAEIKTLQDSLVKKVKSMTDDFDDLTKGLSIDEALEAYNKMVAAGIEDLGSFTEVFKIDENDPSKYVLANSEKLQAYQDAEIAVLQKEASALDEAFAAIQSLSSGANSNDSLTVITTQIRSLQGLKNSSNENLSEEDARILFSHNQDLLKTFDEAGVWDLIYKYLIDENYTEEQLQKAINERVEGLQMSQEVLEEINANAEKYASIKPLLAMGNYKEALGKVDGTPWQPYVEKQMEEAYQSFMNDFLSGGVELIQKNRATYGNDIQGIIDGFDNSNAVAKVKKMYEDGIGWTVEEYNDALSQAVALETKATSGAAQEALKDITFVGDGAFGTLDAVQALADAIIIPLDQLTDLRSPDQFGNYKLNLDNEEIRSKVEGITNYELLYAESVTNFFDEINGWLEDALGGNLDIADRANLTDSLGKLGIQIDPNAFTQTVDGFKLAQSEAYRVLTTLQSINSLAGKVMLSSLVESAMDSDERLNDIFYVMRRIDELNKEINNAKPGTARREELEGELAVCKEITAELKKTDDTFNFMNRDLPSGYDDPLSAWEGIGDAFKVLDGDDFKKNQIGYQDFYNMINFAGDEILAGAKDANGNLITASDLLDAGAQALVNVDGETFVDLSKLGANFNLGATNMKEGLTKGIHTLAQNQIDMLDAEIAMLETVVQTQEAFDKVAGDDNVIDFSELLPTYENGEFTWTSEQQTIVDALGQYASGLKLTLINGVETTLGEVVKDPMLFALINKEGRGIIEALANALNGIDWSLLSGENAKLFQDKINTSLVQFGLQITIDPSKLTEKIQVKEGKEEENPLYQKIVDAAVSRGISKDKIEEAIQKKLKETDKTEITAGELIEIIVGETDEKDKETVENYLLQTAQTDFSEVEVPFTFTPTGKMGTPVVTDSEGKELTGEEVKNKLNELFSLDGDVKVEYTEEVDVEGNVQAHYTFNGKKYTEEQVEKLQKDIMAYQSAQNLSGESSTTSTETDIEIVPQKIYIKEDSGALGEDGSLLITDPIAKATATVTELEIDPTGAKTGMKQAQGAVNSPIEIEITDEITGKASTLTITPSTTPTLELGEETPTVSDVSATAESATVKPTSYQVDLTDSEGNTQSVTVDGTANLETVISGLTKDENGNYSIDSVNGVAEISAEVYQADTDIQTLWDKWNNKEIIFTVKPREKGEGSSELPIDKKPYGIEVLSTARERAKAATTDIDIANSFLTNYKNEIISTYLEVQKLADLGVPINQEDIDFLRQLSQALTMSDSDESKQGYPTVDALEKLADECVRLNNVSPTVLATANTLSTMDLAQTATYLADMVTNAESLIELEFTNFADLETATETAKTTVDSIATKLAEMTGRTITINVVEQQNGNDGEGGNSTYTTTYSFNTDNLTSAVTSIQNASNNATTAIEKVASAMDEIPTDSSKAKAVSDTGKSIKNLPDKKTVKVVISQPKTTSINAVATLTVKVQGEGSVVSGIFEKKFSAPVGGNIDMSRAKGNVALAKGTKTLMGELGPELVVSNGHYFVAGENGAEFVNLADDAIVFNHLQTKKLLQNGNAGRGMAVTNEKKATSMATGNAMASASDALAELKRIRAMWQALLDSSASDLGKKAGSGGGGGGGGGKGDDPKAITHDLERWYNLLRQIAKAEQQITLEQAKRKNMQSGYNYSDSLEKELGILKKQEQAYRQLASLQEDWYNIRRKELLNTDFSKIFTYDKDGLMQYVDGADRGLDILAKLNSTDATGAPTGVGKNSQTQLNYLKSIGFDVEKYLRTNDDGTKAETTDDMMQNFWDRVDGWMEELDGLYDEYNDHLKDIEENVASQNEILQEYIDNQLSVEEKLLNAIVDRQQAQIDKMQDLLDATQNASEEYIKGLTDALNKEQQLYNKNQNDRELSKLQRQLAILQRSGGSASEIKNLQNQIDSKLQSDYFDAMQKQIDTIQEASDNQLEKLQKQIDIATEALEYQKENGLLWQEVYQMMNEWTPEKMLEFIEKYTQSYREDSGLQSSENSKETKKELEIWANKRDMNARDEAWKKYYSDAKYDDAIKKNYSASAQEAFNAGYASGGAEEGARRANEIFENAKKNQGSSTGGNIGGNTGGSSTGSNTTPTQTEGTSRGKVKTNTGAGLYIRSKPDLKAKKVGKIPNGSTMEIYDDYKNSKWYKVRYNGTTGYSYKQYIKKYAQGGLVDYTGPAWVDGSKSKPEAFLSAKDTALLKSKIFSDSNFSLRSCIEAIQALADNFRSISTDNSENINIENISIQVGNGTISSDYSARKAGQEIMDEILNVAKKAGNLTLARR
nr:MAG TPA: minor tail protein [Caudoviricetes sp.]